MNQFLHIYISPKAGVTTDQVETRLNKAIDWFRYDPSCYVVYTSSTAAKWQERLLPLVEKDGYLFISKIEAPSVEGYMTPEFWEWIHKPRQNNTSK